MDFVLNWLVQGSLVAFAAALALRVIAPARAGVRYRLIWVALVLVVALPAIPLFLATAVPTASGAVVEASPVSVLALPARWWTSIAVVAIGCAVWSSLAAARIVAGAIALRRARLALRSFPPDLDARLPLWTRMRARGRRALLKVSTDVRSAAVLAGWPPVIAVAPSVLEHLGDEDLDRIVIHEWAHVQRRDDLANGVQLAIRIAVGWHPAVWWLDRQLRLEREVACDEMVVALTGSARTYAACLTRLASLPGRRRPSLPAVAALSTSNLRPRIVRILAPMRAGPTRAHRALAAGAQAMLCGVAVFVGGFRIVGVEAVEAGRRLVELAVLPASHLIHHVAVVPAPRATAFARVASRRILPERPAQTTSPPAASVPSAPLANGPELPTSEAPPPPLSVTPVLSSHLLPIVDRPASSLSSRNDEDARAKSPRGWTTAADAGVAVGQTSQKAALATAGFFTRFGKKVAASF